MARNEVRAFSIPRHLLPSRRTRLGLSRHRCSHSIRRKSSRRLESGTYRHLALLTTAINQLLRVAFRQGAVIFWWNRAISGSTIEDLHYEWNYANDLRSTISLKKRPFSLVNGAALAIAALMVNGPLLQRASTVITATKTAPRDIVLPIRVQPFRNLTISGLYHFAYEPEFAECVLDASNRVPISVDPDICPGTCTATITIAGFARDCSRTLIPCEDVPLIQTLGTAFSQVDYFNFTFW